MDIDKIVPRSRRVPSADSASKVIHHMQRSAKLLRSGHGLAIDTSIQRRVDGVAGPRELYRYFTTKAYSYHAATSYTLEYDSLMCIYVICSHPSFSLYKLADRRPLPEPRGALFDICSENFHFALPEEPVTKGLGPDDLGQLLSEPVKDTQPPEPAAEQPKADPEAQVKPAEPQAKAPKQKEKKEKKDKEKKVCNSVLQH